MNRCLLFIALGMSGGTVQRAFAQTISVSCPEFFDDRHQAVSCVEAVFGQNNYHFSLAALPPSNGFGPALVLIKKFSGTVGTPAREYFGDFSVTGGVTTNGSWFAGGDLQYLPPLPYQADKPDGLRLGKLRSLSRVAVDVSAWHRTVKTLYYYGNGSASPNKQYLFSENDTAFEVSARMPLTRWFIGTGESEVRSTTLPVISDPAAVSANFPAISTPGILAQPLLLHNSAGAQTLFTPRIGRKFEELPRQDDPHFQSLLLLTLSNNVAFHWQTPVDGSPYSYRQFIYDGHQTIAVHQVLRNFFTAERHPVIRYICNSNKRSDECDFGQFDVKTRLVLTQTNGGNQVPFYLQSTLGGSDIDNSITLRGWDNYRFRGRDLALVQFEYGIPVYDPLGVFIFYDAGTVGNSVSDLAITQFRQDTGFGVSVRLRGHMVAQTFYAFGAGHGGQWNYNFAKGF